MTPTETRGFVDRIEGDKAVLLLGEEEQYQVVIPKALLPEGAGEGSVLSIIILEEPEKTAEATGMVSKLIRKLTG